MNAYEVAATQTHRFTPGKCYACDKAAVGVTVHNGTVKRGCKRHADPKLKATTKPIPGNGLCLYCSVPVRKGSVDVDGDDAHKKCQREQMSN